MHVFSCWAFRFARKLLPTALLGLIFSCAVQAGEISGADYRNVGSLSEADQAVTEILKKAANSNEVILYQVGDRMPGTLEWMIKRLSQKRIRVTVYRVSEEEFQAEVERLRNAPVEYQQLLTFNRNETSGFRGLMDRCRLMVSRLFGIQRARDLSIWVPVERSPDIVKMDRVRGFYAGLTASASLGLSFVSTYLTKGTPPLEPRLLIPVVSLGTWVYYNVNLFRSVGQVMSQGAAIQSTKTGWRVLPNSPFFWSTSFLRSMMTNAIVQATLNGPEALVSSASLGTNVENSFWSVVSRSEIDKYIASKTPTLRDSNGKIVIGPGQWTEKQAANVNFWWNFSHGMIKNLHLVQFDPSVMTWVFGGLAAINLGFFVKEQLPAWTQKVARFGKTIQKGGSSKCSSLLVIDEL